MKILITDDEKYIVSGGTCYGIKIWNVEKKNLEIKFEFQEQASGWLEKNGIELVSVIRFLKV